MFSIIIPTYNEADQIANTISIVHAANGKPACPAGRHEAEIIVVDGGSTDDTISIAEQWGATVVTCGCKGRAAQMNKGASIAKHEIFYFLHADSIPPNNFTTQILRAYKEGQKADAFGLPLITTTGF